MRIVKVGNTIRITYTKEELDYIEEYGILDISIGLLKVLFVDITNIIQEMLPSLKKGNKNGHSKIKKVSH